MASSATVPSPDGSYCVVQGLCVDERDGGHGKDTAAMERKKGESGEVQISENGREKDWVSDKRY